MRHDGKVVDKFRYNGVKTVLELPVRLVKKTERKEQRNAPPGATESCEFVVYIPKGFGKEEEVRGTDIEVLRAVVWGKLDRHFDLEWETYYLITVSDPCFFGHRDEDAGVQLTVEEIDVGKLPDGRTVHRRERYRGADYREGMPKVGMGRRREDQTSLVKQTPETERTLKALCEELRALRKRVNTFLSPDKAAANLAKAFEGMSTIAALEPPKKKRNRRMAKRTKRRKGQ